MSQLFHLMMEKQNNKIKMEQVHLLLHLIIGSEEQNHQKKQYVNLLHFEETPKNICFWNYKKFVREIKKSTILLQNGAS